MEKQNQTDDYLSRRAQFRNVHLEKTWKAVERGEVVPGLANPVDGAILVFEGEFARGR